jgi:MFS family permease
VPETEKEKSDRQLIELLNELRVALPGAQVLLAFLLTAPFQSRFGRTSPLERRLLFCSALVTAAAVLLLMAPSIYHRVRWHEGAKEDVIEVGHRLLLAGTACLALAMSLAVFLVGDFLFGIGVAAAATSAISLVVVATWYALPLRRKRVGER